MSLRGKTYPETSTGIQCIGDCYYPGTVIIHPKTSELITKVNTYADNLTSEPNKKIRQLYINMFLQNKEVLYEYHLNIIDRIENILSYKQYENLNFNKPLRKIDKDSLKNIFIQKSLYEQNKLGATN